MNKEEVIKAIEICNGTPDCMECPLKKEDLSCRSILLENALNYLKENEPAPAGTDTSSDENNNSQLNDTTKLNICQEALEKIKENLLMIYEGMTNEEQRAWELGEIFNQMTNLLKSGDTK